MFTSVREELQQELRAIQDAGLYKEERIITSPQGVVITVNGKQVLNFCANNYLGLSTHPEIMQAAKDAIDTHGYGMSSVRFICGTQDSHKELEAAIARFVGMEDAILYAAAFDANGGLFEPLLDERDAIISDTLNHASIIDGIRLCKAQRFRYRNNDMQDLEDQLKAATAAGARRKMIATDGVFSMDGIIAQVDQITALAERYDAIVMIDDSHATGFTGARGRGTHELKDVMDKVDIVTGTFGKALGGASGGFTAGRKEVIELLRQRSRPYLFSNTLAPAIVGGSLKALELLNRSTHLRDRLEANTLLFRKGMKAAGFTIPDSTHPICPVMLGDAKLAQSMARKLLEEGIYVIGFFYPVVPQDQARIRVQISAAHETVHIEQAIEAFIRVGERRS
jgi:glycine C-acetyltransferase